MENTERERALDMIRHIAAAFDLGNIEVADALNIPHTEAAKVPQLKSTEALRADMEGLIAYARGQFEKTSGHGFNPECFSTLMMAYRSAIEMGSWCEDEH